VGTWEHRAILEGNKGTRTPPWETLKIAWQRSTNELHSVLSVLSFVTIEYNFHLIHACLR